MKTIFLSLLFGLSTVLFSQEYRPLLIPSNEWVISNFSYDFDNNLMHYTDYHYRFTQVTHEINGKQYLEMEFRWRNRVESTPTSNWTEFEPAFFYLAEDVIDRKVYVYYLDDSWHEQGEYLLYDFNLEIGDMMDFSGFVEGEFSESLSVLDITYETVYGLDMVKTYHFEQEWQNPLFIFEGIGSSMGLVFSSFMWNAGWELTDFGINLNTDQITLKKSNVYPNPFKTQIQIESQKSILDLQLFDLSGKMVISKSSVSELNSSLAFLPSGIYHLRIRFEDKTRETIKLIKK